MKKTVALVLALTMVLAFLTSCNSTNNSTNNNANPTASDKSNEKLIHSVADLRKMKVYPSDTASINLSFSFSITALTEFGHQLDHAIPHHFFFESLMVWDSVNNKITGGLAESWEWQGDKVLRIHLYKNIKSIAGDPVTAKDVLWSFNYNNDFGLLSTYYKVMDLKNSKVVDDYTLDLALPASYPFLPLDLCAKYFPIGCEKSAKDIAYNATNNKWDQVKLDWNPSYGTGPYKVTTTDQSTWFKMERNEKYWDVVKPYYKYISVTSVGDPNARAMSVESGDYAFASRLSAANADNLQGNSKFKVWKFSSLGNIMVFRMNSEVQALRNKSLRQAISMAIDYETLCKVVYGGAAEPAYNAMVPTTSEYYVASRQGHKLHQIRSRGC